MRVRFKGETDILKLINRKEYDVLSIEVGGTMYRIVDETGEDYLYSKVEFEVIEE